MPFHALLLSLNLATSSAFVVGPSFRHTSCSPTLPRTAQPAAIFDNDRLRAAGLAALTSLALVASPMPAYAKGGGHGGGGHSSSHSSYHSSHSAPSRPAYPKSATLSSRSSSRPSSSRRRSSGSSRGYSTSTSSDERNIRIFPTTAEAREQGGLICPANLPLAGTKVDINGIGTATVLQSQPALQSGLYGKSGSMAGLPPGFDAGCTLQVQYADGTTDTVSAAKAPPSAIDEALADNPLFALAVYGGLTFAIGALDSDSFSNYDEQRDNYRNFVEGSGYRHDPPAGLASEMSGDYWGGSDESDDGDQALRQTLNFEADGRITGRGRDSEDGSYRITSGRWVFGDNGRVEVAWEEKYDQGFIAICMGKYDISTGKIDGRFVSSREVTGWFSLAKKPSIF